LGKYRVSSMMWTLNEMMGNCFEKPDGRGAVKLQNPFNGWFVFLAE